MSLATIRPRPDQIAELTRGVELPLAPLESIHLELIAETLAAAFRFLHTNHATTVTSGTETEVSALMETRLNALVDESGIWNQLVAGVARGKESLSYDGSHLEKRPDLSLFLTNRPRSFPLVAECKLIDGASGKDEKLYCSQGLTRFLEGDYAWASREAFMLAYVRDGSSISGRLTPYLANASTVDPPGHQVDRLPMKCGPPDLDLAQSRHHRHFQYVGQLQPSTGPGPIVLWHLWLS